MAPMFPAILILIGSATDKEAIEKSGMLEVLNTVGVSWEVSVLSAHRHGEKLDAYCKQAKARGTRVFIGVASMSAQLPGAMAAALEGTHPVSGSPCRPRSSQAPLMRSLP